jgi:hypothetical protein
VRWSVRHFMEGNLSPRSTHWRRPLANQQVLGLCRFADEARHPVIDSEPAIAVKFSGPDNDLDAGVLVIGVTAGTKTA